MVPDYLHSVVKYYSQHLSSYHCTHHPQLYYSQVGKLLISMWLKSQYLYFFFIVIIRKIRLHKKFFECSFRSHLSHRARVLEREVGRIIVIIKAGTARQQRSLWRYRLQGLQQTIYFQVFSASPRCSCFDRLIKNSQT